jgi:hypothetical protein
MVIFDLSTGAPRAVHDSRPHSSGIRLMAAHQGRLFVDVVNTGVLMIDARDPAGPFGVQFLRTLGYGSHLQVTSDDVRVTAGPFGIHRTSLSAPPQLPTN